MIPGNGRRPQWHELPELVRSRIVELLGSPVVGSTSQPGGFSPGSADRVVLADGRRAFVKAVSASVNAESAQLHRREGRIVSLLPAQLPTPAFHGMVDDGDWVALVFADVDGRHPQLPWRSDEIDASIAALAAVAATPAAGMALPAVDDALAPDFDGWRNLIGEPDPTIAVSPDRARELAELADIGLQACAGDRLVHLDVRADNLLVRRDGTVVVVDWPWACAGAPWVDPLLLIANVVVHGGEVDRLLRDLAASHGVTVTELHGFLAGLTGFFLDAARRPPPVGVPGVRAFQRLQGDAVLTFLDNRGVRV